MTDRGTRLRLGEALPRPQELWMVASRSGDHHPALRLGLSAAIPLAALVAIGRVEDARFALLAAVLAAFGRRATPWERVRVQARAGAVQVLLIIVATALAASNPSPMAVVLWTALVAGAGTLLADAAGWTPPGSIFFIFAFGVCATAPADVHDIADAAVIATLAAMITLLVTATWALFGRRAEVQTPLLPAQVRKPWSVYLTHALVCLVASGVAGAVAIAAGFDHPYWAMVAATVPVVGLTTSGQLLRAGHRIVGTLLGVVVAAGLFWIDYPQLAILALVVALTVATELFIARNYSIALLFLTPMTIGMAVIEADTALPNLLAARAIETVVGVIIAILCILATHLVRHPRRRADGSVRGGH